MTETRELTERWARVCENADLIWSGACNPRGIARALVEAIDVACEIHQGNGNWTGTEPELAPAQLILAQLSFLLKTSFDACGGALAFPKDLDGDWTETKMLAVCKGALVGSPK